jgi:hypothetical protein
MIGRPLDVGPIHVNTGAGERYAAAWCEGFDEGWSQASRSRLHGLAGLLIALIVTAAFWLIIGVTVGRVTAAASRSAPEPTTSMASPAPGTSARALSGAPHVAPTATPVITASGGPPSGGAPPTTVTIPPACWPGPCDANWLVRTGDASTYGPGWDGWTAIPEGPGYRIRVCGPADCAELLTTDAGPDQRIHPDRVVDLDVPTFEDVCGVPWRMGTCPVSVTILRVPHG